jgi:excinuclease ABC subunit C
MMDRLGVTDVDTLGIAKVRAANNRKVRGKERIHMASLSEPLLLEGNTPSLFLLQRIRDEAHRFALGHHKRTRSKKISRSRLDEVSGVGPVLKNRLLDRFGSVARVRQATVEDLASVQGVSPELARSLKDVLA